MKLKEEGEGVFNLTSDIKAESNLMITIPTNILNKVKTDSDLEIVKDLEDKIMKEYQIMFKGVQGKSSKEVSEVVLMNSLTLEAFITEHLSENLSKIFERKGLVWESQDIDDSYFLQVCPLYEKSFEGSKKVKITLEVIDEESN